ncbi:hypothetical protein Clacol_001238 [Clathrus columnatus]|uniref:Uncharacterized protein n=1 Tax=Clathrus columnatus TaxID=1419009 RepID=A0AAV5A203_9AGAM|nr:hypothetical protein Clacol_001238 [Clathrus columnatus]
MDAAIGYDIMTRLNCEVWILLVYINGFLGIGLASALLTLRTSNAVTLCTDLVLLTIMLSRIWHQRRSGDLGNLLYRQGVLWVAGATAGELPTIIVIWLDFNYAMNLVRNHSLP